MSYRRLNTEDLLVLIDPLNRYADWLHVKNFAQDLYGPHAVRMTLETYAEYNDEDYSPRAHVEVSDIEGHPLPFDFNLPFFRQFNLNKDQCEAIQQAEHIRYLRYEPGCESFAEAYHTQMEVIAHMPLSVGQTWGGTLEFDLMAPPPLPALFTEGLFD